MTQYLNQQQPIEPKTVWVAEHDGFYLLRNPISTNRTGVDLYASPTFDLARQFSTEIECASFCDEWNERKRWKFHPSAHVTNCGVMPC